MTVKKDKVVEMHYTLKNELVRKAHISINYKHFSLCCIIVAFFKNASILIKYLFFLIRQIAQR
jgi:hypothetical protein